MRGELLDCLRCPQCGNGFVVEYPVVKDGILMFGNLVCPAGHVYYIVNAIPRLLDDSGDKFIRQTSGSFTEKWQRISDYGYDEKTKEFRLSWLCQRYGWCDVTGLTRFLSDKQFILDAGAGLGGYLDTFARLSKGQVFGVDISSCVDIAYQHIGGLSNVHLIQGDLTKLPFKKGQFDFILCDQVLHHTPDTEASFKSLVPFLSDGGEIAIYVYKKKGEVREYCDDMLRRYTTKMSGNDCVKFAEAVTNFGKAISELNLEMQREIYWKVFKCFWNSGMDYDINVMTNFDWYNPHYAWRHTSGEVAEWFRECGLAIAHMDVSDSGISVRGKSIRKKIWG